MKVNLDFTIQFLGWCTIINFGLLAFSSITLTLFRKQVITIHAKLFGIKEKKLPKIYFKFLAYFKLVVIILNLTPYIALKILMSNY